MPATFPAKQNMIAHSPDPAAVLASAMRIFGAEASDIEVADVAPTMSWEQPNFMSRYTLKWYTYKGWRVYMYMTGCIASDPAYETAGA